MTREEIWNNIEKLSELRSKYSCFDEKEKPFYHALSLGIKGIKALEQEPCDDTISRQAVVNAIKYAQVNFTIISTINFANYTKEVQAIADNILSAQIKAINELPSVRPKSDISKYRKEAKRWKNKWLKLQKSGVEPQESEEISERNMKMWEEIFKAESEDKE